jgi:PAS domain S-box-containing protein
MNPFDFIVEESKPLFQKRIKKILSGRKITSPVDYKLKTKKGRVIWANFSVNLLHSNGKVVGGLVFAQDITERKKAEDELKQSEELFSKGFHSNPAAIVISRYADGRIIDVNKTFLRLSGYAYEETVGHTSTELNLFENPADRDQMSNLLLKKGTISNRAMTFRVKSGELKEALFSTEKIRIGSEDCIISTVLDVTERRKLEKELEKYTKNLENIVKERTEKLKDAERLAAIGATAGMVGHDIRNPLQVILGDLYLIASDVALLPEGEEKESIKESLSSIRKSAEYIDKIIQDLQYYAKPLKPIVQKTDLEDLCEDVLFKNGCEENIDVSLNVEKDARILVVDPELLRRILTNLVNNAVQAMPDGGKLDVHVYREGDEVVITVQDSGVGVPEDAKDKLFTPLFTTKAKGQGFGLPVVKRMTESLGGTVTFESEEGKGAKFIIRLPTVKG